MAKGKKVTGEKISREGGFLYYVGKDGFVWKTPMKHNKSGRKGKVGKEKIVKKYGFMYYVGEDGSVYETKLKNVKG